MYLRPSANCRTAPTSSLGVALLLMYPATPARRARSATLSLASPLRTRTGSFECLRLMSLRSSRLFGPSCPGKLGSRTMTSQWWLATNVSTSAASLGREHGDVVLLSEDRFEAESGDRVGIGHEDSNHTSLAGPRSHQAP